MVHAVKSRLFLLFSLLLVLVALPLAADVTVTGTVNFSSLDGSAQDDDHTANGVFTVNGNLTIQGTVNCNDSGPGPNSACAMRFNATGNITMAAGSALYAENRLGPGSGGNITLQSGGNVTIQGPAGSLGGALISSGRSVGGGLDEHAGNITITSGGTTNLQAGSVVSAAAEQGTAGTISVNAQGAVTVAGLVAAGGSSTVSFATKYTGAVLSGGLPNMVGGTIIIKSATHTPPAVTVTGDGIIVTQGGITSPGPGPGVGTGTVTLEGCDVRVNGLVASLSGNGSGARVDVRSGTSITVDSRDFGAGGPASGRFGIIRADSTFQGTTGAMRADLFAANDITILGPTPASSSLFSVNAHAGALVHDVSGAIRAISTGGAVTASGNAFAASGTNLGDQGGSVSISSKNDATLNGATLTARGDTGLDPFRKGGAVNVRSYSGAVNWQTGVGDVRPTGTASGIPVASQGTITLTYCTSVSTSGTSFPTNGPAAGAFPTLVNTCSPAAPSLPAGEPVLPTCNRPPVANDDNYTVAEGGTLNVAAPGVLTNDTDPDGDPITAVLVSGPAHASSFTLNADGSFNYVHDGSETTSDSFTYKASDGASTSNLATVHITITPVNDPPVANNDTATVLEGGTINMAAPGVLANDTDPDGPSLTAVLVSGPAHASSFVLNANGSYIYVHDGSETTTDSFTYKASDGSLFSNVATVNITITPVNDAPTANNDSYSVNEGGTLNVAAPGVLGNDTDPDSPALTAVLVSGPAHASSFTLNANGSFNYVHDGSETTSDSFTYKASDGSLFSTVATVNITVNPVNDAPVAAPDAYSVNEGGTLSIAAPGVLGNDTDPDSPTLTAILVSGPAHASSFVLNANGSFNYVHDGSETTTDSFSYKANDGSLDSNVVTVTITINPVNDPPAAANDSYTVAEGGTLNVAAPGVLGNDTDPDSPVLTASLIAGPAHASSFTLNADGSFTYVHDGSETTSDSFTYVANDGMLNSNIATVQITVTPVDDAPVAAPDTYSVNEGGTLNITAPGVLGNDTDVDSPTLTAVLVSGPVHASAFTLNPDGSFNYVHDGSETTVDSFSYKANDGTLDSNIVSVTINIIPVNDAPVVTAGGSLTFTEGDPATVIDNTVTVTDADSPNLVSATVQITGNYVNGQDVLGFTNTANITGVFAPATGTLTLTGTDTVANYQAALRSVTYSNSSTSPSTADRTVTWTANDGTTSSAPVTSTIHVISVNDAPVLANGSSISYTENDPATVINSVITVTDTDSPNLVGATVQITGNYANGQDVLSFTNAFGITGSFSPATGTLTLSGSASVANYQSALRTVKYSNTSDDPSTGTRTVSFRVDDGSPTNNLSNIVTSTIAITAVNDAPTAFAFSGLPAQAGIPITYPTGKLGGTDLEAGTTITVDTTPINVVNGTVALNGDGSFTFTPRPSAAGGTASFQYRVADNGNPAPGLNSAYVTVSFNVAGPAIYFTRNVAVGANNCTLGNECTATTALVQIGATPNTFIFIGDANTQSTGPIPLNSGGSIIGQGVTAASFDAFFGIGTPSQGTLAPRPAVNQPHPTLVNSPVTMNNNSQVRGLTLSNNSGDTLIASSKSGLVTSDLDITTSANNSAQFAVNFVSSSGTFSFGSITVTSPNAGSGVNFSATASGSPVTFGSVSTTSGAAVTVANSGSTAFNFGTVTSTTGKAVGVSTANGAFTFTKISSNGAAKGITVNALTGGGSFTVNGTGGLCDSTHTSGSDCTGGTIQGGTSRGAELTNAVNVTLKNMYFKGNGTTNSGASCVDNVNTGSNATCNAAVFFGSTTSSALDHVYLDGTGSADMGLNGNNVNGLTLSTTEIANFTGNQKTAALFQNLTGTANITALNAHNNALAHNVFITNNTGTANITFTSAVIQNSPLAATGNADGIDAQAYGAATTLNITSNNGTFNNLIGNTTNWAPNTGAHMTAVLNGGTSTLTAGILMASTGNNTVMNYTINGLTSITTNATGSNGITVGRLNGASSSETGVITNNTINVGSSSCSTCMGIGVNSYATSGLSTTTVSNNVIGGNIFNALNIVNAGGASSLNMTVQGNSMSTTQASGDAGYAIDVTSGGFGADTNCTFLNLGDMSPTHTVPANRNTIVGANWDFGGNQISLVIFDNAQLKLSNYTGSTDAQAAAWVTASNVTTGTDAFHFGTNNFAGGAVCP